MAVYGTRICNIGKFPAPSTHGCHRARGAAAMQAESDDQVGVAPSGGERISVSRGSSPNTRR